MKCFGLIMILCILDVFLGTVLMNLVGITPFIYTVMTIPWAVYMVKYASDWSAYG